MDASFHGHDRLAAQSANDEVAFMADGGGHGEAGNLGVGDDERIFDLVGELAETAAEDDADFRLASLQEDRGHRLVHVLRCVVDFFDTGIHRVVS